MINIFKDKKGLSLVEVMVAIALLVIMFSMFGTLVASSYKASRNYEVNKSARENEIDKGEKYIATGSGMIGVGTAKITLDLSEDGTNSSGTKAEWNADVSVSDDYGKSGDAEGKYIYAYRATTKIEPTT